MALEIQLGRLASNVTAGGTILIGVEDGTRNVRGAADLLALEERVSNLISDSITPRLLPDVEILAYRKTHVVAVQVFPSSSRPHFLKKAGMHDGTYVRVGSTNRRADDALFAEMQRFSQGEAFDERPMPELNSEAIDFPVASESFRPCASAFAEGPGIPSADDIASRAQGANCGRHHTVRHGEEERANFEKWFDTRAA